MIKVVLNSSKFSRPLYNLFNSNFFGLCYKNIIQICTFLRVYFFSFDVFVFSTRKKFRRLWVQFSCPYSRINYSIIVLFLHIFLDECVLCLWFGRLIRTVFNNNNSFRVLCFWIVPDCYYTFRQLIILKVLSQDRLTRRVLPSLPQFPAFTRFAYLEYLSEFFLNFMFTKQTVGFFGV